MKNKDNTTPSTSTVTDAAATPKAIRRISIRLADRAVEQVSGGGFVVRRTDGTQNYADSVDIPGAARILPLTADQLAGSGVILPSGPASYGKPGALDVEIMAHVQKYVVLPSEVLPLVPLFIRYTWLNDCMRVAPYLRISGPTGSGKSRAARVIGHLCRLPYMTNGATSEAALYRNIGLLGVCTTVLDENEAEENNATQVAITRILKVGFEWDGAVERCAEVTDGGNRTYGPERHKVFGPKILVAIEHVPDRALRSRCFSIPMEKSRHLPIVLPHGYEAEVNVLQNKLLGWRLDNVFNNPPEPQRLGVDGRLEQLRYPLAIVATPEQLGRLDDLVLELQEELDDEASADPEHAMAGAIADLVARTPDQPITYDRIISATRIRGVAVGPQKVGYFIKSLGLKAARRGNRGSRHINAKPEEIGAALSRAGYDEGQEQAA